MNKLVIHVIFFLTLHGGYRPAPQTFRSVESFIGRTRRGVVPCLSHVCPMFGPCNSSRSTGLFIGRARRSKSYTLLSHVSHVIGTKVEKKNRDRKNFFTFTRLHGTSGTTRYRSKEKLIDLLVLPPIEKFAVP
jgi:hypothetical protein